MWIKVITITLLFQLMLVRRVATASLGTAAAAKRMDNDTFLYFAYGSNLLGKRIHIQNPSAVRKGIGRLKDYRLDFCNYATRWGGAPSTIVPDAGRDVWGAIWEISLRNLESLDSQEGVDRNVYRPMQVAVETPSGKIENCRVYMLCDYPGQLLPDQEFTNQPSKTYIHVIISGAIESGLPEEYVQWLKEVKHNGKHGIPELEEALREHLASVDKKTTPPQSPLIS